MTKKIFENYFKQNLNEQKSELKAYQEDRIRRANSYLVKIEKELLSLDKPLRKIKSMIDAMPPWVENLMPSQSWEALGDVHDLSKINVMDLAIDFNQTGSDEDYRRPGDLSDFEEPVQSQDNDISNLVGTDQQIQENASIFTSDPGVAEIVDIIVDEINAAFNNLPDDSPLKNRESALIAMKEMKNLVSEDIEITLQDLRDAVSARLAAGGQVSDREKRTLLNNFSQEQLEDAGITFDVVDDDEIGDPSV
tara:strand:- start:263 stop:1012 length:750 start_codon:yes stop_codon:yes gene_type:complete